MWPYALTLRLPRFLVTAFVLAVLLDPAMALADEVRGRVVYLRGTVTATDSLGVPRLLRQDSRVMSGDEIETGPQGVVQLVFPDGSMLHIKHASKVLIEAYRFSPDEPDKDKTVLKALKGSFRALTGTIGKRSANKVEYKTPVATIGIRGTAVEIGTDDQGVSFANFDFGRGVVSSGGTAAELLSGQSATVKTHAGHVDTAALQRSLDDPATLAATMVNTEASEIVSGAKGVCAKLGPEDTLLLVAIQRQAPGFNTTDLLASVEGLVGCLSTDVSSPMLTMSTSVYPESADKLLDPAVKGGLNIAIALDSVLRGMENADPKMIDRVVTSAVKSGISMQEATRILTGLRDDGLCR